MKLHCGFGGPDAVGILCMIVSNRSKRRKQRGGDRRGALTPPGQRAEIGGADLDTPGLMGWRAGVFLNPLRDAVLLWCVVILIVVSRWLAFPASIWDMDEANFALGVLHFDPIHNQPHAPFFPLWIGLGKIAHWVLPGGGPAGALQLVSAGFSVLILWPLLSLWSTVLTRTQALAAAVLYLALPGPWLLSGRAYTEPTATALLVVGVALWLPPAVSRGRLAGGGVALMGALLVRPQWLVVVVPLVLWRVVRSKWAVERAIIVGVPVAMGSAVVAVVAAGSGGLSPLWAAIQQHRKYMAGASENFEWGFSDLAVHAATGGAIAGTLWIFLAVLGCVVLLRNRGTRAKAGVLFGLVVVPLVLLLLTTQNPTLPRYALPVLALTAGAVVAGISKLVQHPRGTTAAIGFLVMISVVLTVPVLGRYRGEPSPVMAAFRRVESNPSVQAVAVDRRLVAFVTLEKASGRLRQQVLWDYQVELGMVESPFRRDLAALSTQPYPAWVTHPESLVNFRCNQPLLRRIASPRFLDLTVIEGCALVRPENPSVRPEDLRPGTVIPAS